MDYVLPRNTPAGNANPYLPYWNGDRAAGVTGAIPPAAAFTEPMMEIRNAISLSGQTPDHNNLYQLFQAIENRIAAAISGGLTTIEVPPGTVSAFAGLNQPAGWLFCRGQAVSRSVFSALFGQIGALHGAGDGSTTFNVPNLAGEFIRGFDAGRGIDAGRSFGSGQADEFRAHTHAYQQFETIPNGERDNNAQAGIAMVGAVTGITGGSETRPRNIALNYIIKT
jgi:Phage Tail Collar Domain